MARYRTWLLQASAFVRSLGQKMKLDIRLLFAFAGLALWCALTGAAEKEAGGDAEADRAVGQRIYRAGILPSGNLMKGMAQAGVLRTGKDAACIACHRRSGFGTAEGPFIIRPITGPDLYQTRVATAANPRIAHQLGKPLRPVYDDASLAKAIRDGVDVTGRRMQGVMPRYALSDSDMAALQTYLKTLFVATAAGVDATEINLATVIQPNVSEAKRRAMLDVLEAFVRDKNAGVRSEESRRTAGTMRMHRAYRKWVLHVWQLDGAQESWGAQLEDYYRRQPVFALVSGLGDGSWQPIHEFSERFEVPCILPMTQQPALGESNFYTVYFSRGISLEADALGKFIGDYHQHQKVIQVYRRDGIGAVAAAAFRAALPDAKNSLEDRLLPEVAGSDFWRALASKPLTAIVLWLQPDDLSGIEFQPIANSTGLLPIYLSATLSDGRMAMPGAARVLMTYPWEVPAVRDPLVARSRHWLDIRKITSAEDAIQVNALFAITVAGDALSHLMDSFSREYFVERVEHNVTTTLMPSFFPLVSLGPDQRFASKGAYIVRAGGASNWEFIAVSGLIVP